MKYENYQKPELEEIELVLEGSYLNSSSIGVDKGDTEQNDDEWD